MSLPDLFRVLFVRQRRVFIAVFVVTVAVVVAVTLLLPKQHVATATLFVGENRSISAGAGAVQLDEVLARTYTSLLGTSATKRKVLKALPFPFTESELTSAMSFEVVNGTRLISVNAEDRDATTARILANTYARTFVLDLQSAAGEQSAGRLAELNRRIGQLARLAKQLETNPDPAAAGRRQQALSQLAALKASYQAAEESLSLQGNNVAVSSLAQTPGSPSKPRPKLYVAVGIVLAFLLAAAAALLRNLFDKRVRDEDELVQLTGAPILARVPARRRKDGEDPAVDEAIQFLRANLQHGTLAVGRGAIAVTSALPGEGKTTVTGALARAFAVMGNRAVAVDCDLRKPRLAESMQVEPLFGLTNVLLGTAKLEQAVEQGPEQLLGIIGSGPLPPNPAVVLGGGSFHEVLDTLRNRTDYIVIDTPPVAAGAESSVIASEADAVVLVVDLDTTRRDALVAACEQLRQSDAPLVGVVVNRYSGGAAGIYGYYRQRSDGGDESPKAPVGAGSSPSAS